MADYIYLDNNATTQPLPEVVDAMARSLREAYANPSSVHQFGQAVRHQVECARAQVAQLLNANPKEIIFTSGGTESINLAIRGGLSAMPQRRRIVTTAVEHSAVLAVVAELSAQGYQVDYVGVDDQGRLNEAQWNEKITDQTALISIMHANNETGVIFDIERLAQVAAERGALVHVDAVQSVGKLPLDVSRWPANFVSIAAHKFHGPKGVGALYVRRRTRLNPMIVGGGQERERRGGTEHVAGIIGMGVAAEAVLRDAGATNGNVRAMRDTLETGISKNVPFAHVNAALSPRLANTSNISFEHLEAEAILILLSEAGICASSGAACSSGSLEPSHVLKAMGLSSHLTHGAIRFSLSGFNTPDQIAYVVATLPGLLGRLVALSGRSTRLAPV